MPAGVIEPTTDPVEVLWHLDGGDAAPAGPDEWIDCDRKVDRTRRMGELFAAVKAALPERRIDRWIDRSTCPPTFPIVITNAGSSDLGAFLDAVGGEQEATRNRVALTTIPFAPEDFRAALKEVERILEEEGHEDLGLGHSGIVGATLELDFAELEVAVKGRLDAEIEIPIRYYVESGP